MRRPFLWLHVKKCGGQSMRRALGDDYVQVDRREPARFEDLPREAWNDNLNNYRVDLGAYDYRRLAFAREHLYGPEDFDARFRFTVVRNPFERAVSCWRFLSRRRGLARLVPGPSLEAFLESLPELWETRSNRHVATHTAPVWPDVTDAEGRPLVEFIAHLERIHDDFAEIVERAGLTPRAFPHENRGPRSDSRKSGRDPALSRHARGLVEELYADDLEHLGYDL